MSKTIYWHDYETFGADPRRDRAAQFAGIRTDEDLNIIGEPLVIYCRPAPDMLPHPQSCLITGITPQKALEQGLSEAEFIARIHTEFSRPGTCVAGYNSIRFDDELTRQLLYRNFYDPYEREWKNGNSRWDIIDMVRLCAAVRPEGINWPRKEDGSVSFRLEQLTAANNIVHADAHDALSDVMATIAMARLIRERQPRLYAHIFQLRAKQAVSAGLDLQSRKPVLHVSVMYPASRGCLALIAPLCKHPVDSNGIIVCDLRQDPREWLDLPVEELRRRLFTPQSQLGEGEERAPLKIVHLNRCPVVVPAAVLDASLAQQYEVDPARCQTHWQVLNASLTAERLRTVSQAFDRRLQELPEDLPANEAWPLEDNPDFMIYSGGFFSDADKRILAGIRRSAPSALAGSKPGFQDGRLHEMLFRYRARNWPETLTGDELQRWTEYCRQCLGRSLAQTGAGLGLQAFREEMQRLRVEPDCQSADVAAILDALASYADALASHLQMHASEPC